MLLMIACWLRMLSSSCVVSSSSAAACRLAAAACSADREADAVEDQRAQNSLSVSASAALHASTLSGRCNSCSSASSTPAYSCSCCSHALLLLAVSSSPSGASSAGWPAGPSSRQACTYGTRLSRTSLCDDVNSSDLSGGASSSAPSPSSGLMSSSTWPWISAQCASWRMHSSRCLWTSPTSQLLGSP
ncbi:hypothetical protein COO60DRAFT_1520416 [Scenedesmus sp. NREL 46B-D3]|nr:hypothetical protein COO60DRAFT_1520416 [Scenedesmus sp. NREL 46B-D3]